MSFFGPQNPGLGGLDEITDAEELILQNLAALSYSEGDVLYVDANGDFARLPIGTNGQVLTVNSGATAPEWATGGGSDTFASIEVDGVAVSTAAPTLDFDGTDFSVTESPTDDFDITINAERIQDIAGAMVTGNTETLITVTYQDADGTIDFVVDNDLANYSNATSAFITASSSDSLTNKTIDADNNTISNIALGAEATGALGDLSDVTQTSLTSDEILGTSDGSTWINRTLAEAGIAPVASPTFTGTVTLPTGLTGVLRADSGVVSTDSDVTDLVTAADLTTAGKVEIATAAETTTGTDATRAVSPDGLAGSTIFGVKSISVQVIDGATALTTGDGKAYIRVPSSLNGMDIIEVAAQVITTSSSGTPTVQVARGRQSSPTSDFTYSDVLSTLCTIDASEYDSKNATTAAVINTSNDDLATGDVLRIDVDVAGTSTTGLNVTINCQLP